MEEMMTCSRKRESDANDLQKAVVKSAKRAKPSEEEVNFDTYLTSRGAELVGFCDDESAMRACMTATKVGGAFVVVFVYHANDSDEDTREEGEDAESSGDMIETWTARVSVLKAINANVNTNDLELHFWHNNSTPVYMGPVAPQPDLSGFITVRNCKYYLYTVPAPLRALIPEADTTIPSDFLELVELAGHEYLAPFSNYAEIQKHLHPGSLHSSFLIVHMDFCGWSGYTGKFVDIDDCLGQDLPLFIFDYDNTGDNPVFCTDESQLPDSQLPDMRVGASLTYFLFSAPHKRGTA